MIQDKNVRMCLPLYLRKLHLCHNRIKTHFTELSHSASSFSFSLLIFFYFCWLQKLWSLVLTWTSPDSWLEASFLWFLFFLCFIIHFRADVLNPINYSAPLSLSFLPLWNIFKYLLKNKGILNSIYYFYFKKGTCSCCWRDSSVAKTTFCSYSRPRFSS